MKRGLGVTIAIFICLVVQFVGLGVYMFMKLPDPPMLPLYWCGVAISGFAAIISALLVGRESGGATISGIIGLYLLVI